MTNEIDPNDHQSDPQSDEDTASPPAEQEGEAAAPTETSEDARVAESAPGDAPEGETESGADADADAGAEVDAAEAAIELDLPVFHGPLDLLLHLIERNELDITEVSLLEVTDQYLGALRSKEQIDLGAMAEFISVAARLLLLKSRALLPRDPDEAPPEDEDEGSDVRALIEALREYRRFKQAAEFLRERPESRERGVVCFLHDLRPRHAGADIEQIRHLGRRDEFCALPCRFVDQFRCRRDVRRDLRSGAHLDAGSGERCHDAIQHIRRAARQSSNDPIQSVAAFSARSGPSPLSAITGCGGCQASRDVPSTWARA